MSDKQPTSQMRGVHPVLMSPSSKGGKRLGMTLEMRVMLIALMLASLFFAVLIDMAAP